ncbi:MAG TPA: hypothetical protein VK731_02965, partial [Candidatus Cybelea sp.]|nr:hypothetical protein [Candidatus Cybelea sp.]
MPFATNVFDINSHADSRDAKMVGWALAGMLNQTRAEVYVTSESLNESHYRKLSHMPHEDVQSKPGADGGLRAMFDKYKS